jgi:hypothetical protein
VTASTAASYSVNFVNRNSTPVTITFAMSASSATPTNAELSMINMVIPENGVIERTGCIATSEKFVVVNSSHANVSAQIYGFEE